VLGLMLLSLAESERSQRLSGFMQACSSFRCTYCYLGSLQLSYLFWDLIAKETIVLTSCFAHRRDVASIDPESGVQKI